MLAAVERFNRRSRLHRPAIGAHEPPLTVPVCHILFTRVTVSGPRERCPGALRWANDQAHDSSPAAATKSLRDRGKESSGLSCVDREFNS